MGLAAQVVGYTKRCTQCHKVKLAEGGFPHHKARSDGYAAACLACARKAIQKWYWRQPKKRSKAKQRERRRKFLEETNYAALPDDGFCVECRGKLDYGTDGDGRLIEWCPHRNPHYLERL